MNALMEEHWNNSTFDGWPVDDYETIKLLLKEPLRDVHKFSALVDVYKKMSKHLDKLRTEVVFMKCEDELCCPEFRSTNLKIFFQKTNMGFPAPTPS